MTLNTELKNKLVCTVTGKTVSVAPKVFDERAVKYGSAEILRQNYICTIGRKLLCLDKTVADIRAEFNVPDSVPQPSAAIVLKYIKWAKYRNKTATNTALEDIKNNNI